jgi:hypothetical protein
MQLLAPLSAPKRRPHLLVWRRSAFRAHSLLPFIKPHCIVPSLFAQPTRSLRYAVTAHAHDQREVGRPEKKGPANLLGRASRRDVAELAAVVALGAEARGWALRRNVAEVAAVEALLAAARGLGHLLKESRRRLIN